MPCHVITINWRVQRLTCAYSETHEATQLHLLELLLIIFGTNLHRKKRYLLPSVCMSSQSS